MNRAVAKRLARLETALAAGEAVPRAADGWDVTQVEAEAAYAAVFVAAGYGEASAAAPQDVIDQAQRAYLDVLREQAASGLR